MWKKALWIYLGIYCVANLYLIVYGSEAEGFGPSSIVTFAVLLFPAVIVAFELQDKKVSALITLTALLIVAVLFIGVLNFTSMSMDAYIKAFLFTVMIIPLTYYAFKRIFKK